MTQPGIEPATYRFVAQHLNHCATAVPPTILSPGQIHYLVKMKHGGPQMKHGGPQMDVLVPTLIPTPVRPVRSLVTTTPELPIVSSP